MKKRRGITQVAMQYGTKLGILWIFAFTIYIMALTRPNLSLLFLILLIISPLYAGYLGIKYRKKERENKLSFTNAWIFTTIMYLCASILSAIACYVYFSYMDNGVALSSFKEQIDIYTTMEIGEETKKALSDTYDIIAKMNASDICIQYLTSNLCLTTFLAPLTSLFVFKK